MRQSKKHVNAADSKSIRVSISLASTIPAKSSIASHLRPGRALCKSFKTDKSKQHVNTEMILPSFDFKEHQNFDDLPRITPRNIAALFASALPPLHYPGTPHTPTIPSHPTSQTPRRSIPSSIPLLRFGEFLPSPTFGQFSPTMHSILL
ncbi:hypothetical protein HBH92_232310 [Parastagonospora nodorum]|nr:hypothetical protein HBH52_030970 [Parastagonospora nodorum]KAH4400496.1 hypothetical protein HBH92_232310 [Parastagonospora nodorum]KAH4404494.1 hypothetical protein HBH93_235420 [Parastagonospora nodorum]KAH4428951.1 hypothetical protein HBH91_239630 [Parastagonospora nodorum]KAH4483976.1 hypothetical protein HBH89_231410 [Parastagonospora nodorum]